jgi:hypothetical protein
VNDTNKARPFVSNARCASLHDGVFDVAAEKDECVAGLAKRIE